MAFIKDSVGQGGKNAPADVQVVKWMLTRAQNNYGTVLFDACYNVQETGMFDAATGSAIKSFIKYRQKVSNADNSSLLSESLNQNSQKIEQLFVKSVITPDDADYKYLLKCTLKPVCVTPDGMARVGFGTDSLVTQALAGKLGFQAFRHAVIIKDGDICETSELNDTTNLNQLPIPYAKYKDSTVRFSSSEIVDKLTKIAADYHANTGSTLTLTDGDRTALEQAYMMIRQIRKGELGLYTQRQAAAEVKKTYDAGTSKGKTDEQIAQDIGKVIQNQIDSQGIYISRHLRNRGADVRSRDMDGKELPAFKKAAQKYGVTVLKEGDHLHLQF